MTSKFFCTLLFITMFFKNKKNEGQVLNSAMKLQFKIKNNFLNDLKGLIHVCHCREDDATILLFEFESWELHHMRLLNVNFGFG